MEPQHGRRGSGHTVMLRSPASKYSRSGELMSFRHARRARLTLVFLFSIFPLGKNLFAQTPSGGLSGVVTDPSGASIAKASIRLTNPSGASLDPTTNRAGFYAFKSLPPRTYTLQALANSFPRFTQ